MIARDIEKVLNKWCIDGQKPLLVTGARQIGKTYIIRSVLENNNIPYIEINFIEQPELIKVIDTAANTDDLMLRLSVASDKEIIEDKTVFFLDEVQECKELITKIKFLAEANRYRFILSGSLLGVELNDIRSTPVGYLDIVDMYPITLMEFFKALGIQTQIIDYLKQHYEDKTPIDEVVHKRMMEAFYLYLLIGGMPEAVQKYLDLNQIIRTYHRDFTKYEKRNKLQLREIYDAIPSELEEKNKRFYISHLSDKKEYDDYKNSFIWLKDAGVALPVYNIVEPVCPLKTSEKRNLFKLFMSDVGLLTSQYSPNVRIDILNREASINNGGLFENVVAQELVAKHFDVYYFNSKKYGELDFVIELDGKSLPIEVKSGKDYKRHSALNNVLSSDNYSITEAYVFCNDNLHRENNIIYMPIYMVALIENKKVPDGKYRVDLSDLKIHME